MTGHAADVEGASVPSLAEQARTALRALAARPEPEAFQQLLALSQLTGECLGESARTLAAHGSWSQVASVAGTTKQAAWSRWRA
jgi:hypothetical protein